MVRHKLFDYRGVIFDAEATFQGSDEWYEAMARTRPESLHLGVQLTKTRESGSSNLNVISWR